MNSSTSSRKRCSHCATEKTPLWRTGPIGAKTLCNACGMQYRVDRLVPEYRPVASPTFESTRHSNLQVKVLELRQRKEILDGEVEDSPLCQQNLEVDLLDMSEESRDLIASPECPVLGPDYFSFCTHEVALLLSQDDSIVPFKSQTSELPRTNNVKEGKDATKHHLNCKEANLSAHTPLFSNSMGSGISDIRRERLKVMLRENVITLSQEVDESTHSIAVLQFLQSHVQYKERHSNKSGDNGKIPQKKMKSPSSDVPTCSNHVDVEASKKTWSPLNCPCVEVEREDGLNSCLRLVLENGNLETWNSMKKGHFDRLYATVKHMEVQLEELLNTLMSKCRQMSLKEKNELRNMIEKLPPRNIDCVVEIIQHRNEKEAHGGDEIHVDLKELDNVTLWRLYYYMEAVKRATKLPQL